MVNIDDQQGASNGSLLDAENRPTVRRGSRVVGERVDVCFQIRGRTIPLDHGYLLFSAISKELEGATPGGIHNAEWLAVHPVDGIQSDRNTLWLEEHSSVTLRIDLAEIPRVIRLAGKSLRIGPSSVRLGHSSIRPLATAPSLRARIVTVKTVDRSTEPGRFVAAIRRQLDELAVKGRVDLGRRRVMTVAGKVIVGYGVSIHDLSDNESLLVLYAGLGGKQRMGAGVFVPRGDR